MNSVVSMVLVIVAFSVFAAAYPVSIETSEVEAEDELWVKLPMSHIQSVHDPVGGAGVFRAEKESALLNVQHHRNRRSAQNNEPRHPLDKPFNLNAEVNHSRQSGTNVYADGTARLWQSQNQRHEIHGNANYGQHFGGPYGRSPPSFGGGLIYRHRF